MFYKIFFFSWFTIILINSSFSQKRLSLIFGDGFDHDTCTVIMYNERDYDTLMFNKVITSKIELGLAEIIEVNYPRSNKMTSIRILINNEIQGNYTFDILKNKSELLIDFFRDLMLRNTYLQEKYKQSNNNLDYKTKWKYEFLEFHLKQKGGFKFY